MSESRQRERAGEQVRLLGKTTLYFQLNEMEESHQEATEKEVERILGLLQTYFREDRKYDTKFMVEPFVFISQTRITCNEKFFFKKHFQLYN